MKRKILIVDDEEGITEAFERLFRDEYEVLLTNDGEDAIRLINEKHPELVVLDWRLKGTVEGKDVLLFSKQEHPEIPVCVLTASTHLQNEIQSLGANHCFFKPCQNLKEQIRQIVPPQDGASRPAGFSASNKDASIQI